MANPDVWVDVAATWRFEAAGVSAVTFEWRFDEYFSSRSIDTYDTNGNGTLEVEEISRLRSEAFDPLSAFDYYAHVWVDGDRRTALPIADFLARIDGPHLVYRFTVALQPPLDPEEGDLVVSLHDPRTVVDFQFVEKRFLLVEGTLDPDCRFRMERGRGALSGHAQPVTLSCGG